MATRRPRVLNGVVAMRKNWDLVSRYPKGWKLQLNSGQVVTHILTWLNFSFSQKANLIPKAGILYFSLGVPVDILNHACHITVVPAYDTTYRFLRGLSNQSVKLTKALGRNPEIVYIIRMDDAQNYLFRQDPRTGHENILQICIAATANVLEDSDPKALDLNDRLERIARDERRNLSVDQP